MQVFCVNCGNQLAGDQANCPYCGTQQPSQQQQFQNQQMPSQPMMGQPGMQQPMMNGQQPMMNGGMPYGQQPMMNGQMPMNQQQAQAGAISWGWVVLGFLIPLAGWILWGVWKTEKPATAKACGIAGFVGFALNLFILL